MMGNVRNKRNSKCFQIMTVNEKRGKKGKGKKKAKDHFHKEPTDQAKTNITLIALISNKLR